MGEGAPLGALLTFKFKGCTGGRGGRAEYHYRYLHPS